MLGFFISKSSLWFLSLLSFLGEDDTCPEENEDLALKGASLENKGRTSNPSESATFCQVCSGSGILSSPSLLNRKS